jgi:hypothetical protein
VKTDTSIPAYRALIGWVGATPHRFIPALLPLLLRPLEGERQYLANLALDLALEHAGTVRQALDTSSITGMKRIARR